MSDEYLRKVKKFSPAEKKMEMEKIQKMFKKAKEHGEDKVSRILQPSLDTKKLCSPTDILNIG